MILRKPYAFLIRHFKLIHFVLGVFLCLNFYYSYHIVKFFNQYIENGYRATSTYNLVQTYAPFSFLIYIIVVIVISFILSILLSYKKKPHNIYNFMIIYYIILIGLFGYIYGVFGFLENEVITATLARAIRDVGVLYIIFQAPFIILVFIRFVGFDLKKFAFESDFKEMSSIYSDSEEVEVGINIESYKFKRKIKKDLREFKYYIIENKFVVILILVILLGVIGYSAFTTIKPSYERYISVNTPFIYGDYEITIKDSLITDIDYKGDVINQGKYYIALKVSITNLQTVSNKFDYNIIKLMTNNGIISPKQSYASNFIDFANVDTVGYILGEEEKEVLICYEIDREDLSNNYRLILSDGTTNYRGQLYNKSIYIRIQPKMTGEQAINNYNINDKIAFYDDYLSNNNLTITKYKLAKLVKYNYEYCLDSKCKQLVNIVNVSPLKNRQDNYLINLTGTYDNSNNNSRYSDIRSILMKNGSVEYTINGTTKAVSIIDVTPDNYKEGVIFEVPHDVIKGKNIYFVITTRYNKYVIKLK